MRHARAEQGFAGLQPVFILAMECDAAVARPHDLFDVVVAVRLTRLARGVRSRIDDAAFQHGALAVQSRQDYLEFGARRHGIHHRPGIEMG